MTLAQTEAQNDRLLDRLLILTRRSHSHEENEFHGFGDGRRVPARRAGLGEEAGDVEEQIKALHEQGRQAALKGDVGFLRKYLAVDYIGVGSDGRMFTRDETITRRISGAVRIESIDERDVKIRVYGDAAIVNSLASVRGTIDSKPITGDSRAVFVYVKQKKGSWKEVAFQVTQVAPASK